MGYHSLSLIIILYLPIHLSILISPSFCVFYPSFLIFVVVCVYLSLPPSPLCLCVSIDFNGDNSSYVSYLVNRVTSGDLSSKVAGWQACTDTSAPFQACSVEWAQESVELACTNAYVDVRE